MRIRGNFFPAVAVLLSLAACLPVSPPPSKVAYARVATPEDAEILFMPMIGGGTVVFSLNTTKPGKDLCRDFEVAQITAPGESENTTPTAIPAGQPVAVSASLYKQSAFGAACNSAPVIVFVPEKGVRYRVGFARQSKAEASTCVITIETESKLETIGIKRFKACRSKER